MTDDDKLEFFLRHWKQLVEWNALRTHAAELLDQALIAALEAPAANKQVPTPKMPRGSTRIAQLPLTRAKGEAWLELNWSRSKLFAGGWPHVVVVWNQGRGNLEVRAAVKQATADLCAERGMTKAGKGRDYWVWYKALRAEDEPFDIDEFAQHCVESLREAWIAMHLPMEESIATVLRRGSERGNPSPVAVPDGTTPEI